MKRRWYFGGLVVLVVVLYGASAAFGAAVLTWPFASGISGSSSAFALPPEGECGQSFISDPVYLVPSPGAGGMRVDLSCQFSMKAGATFYGAFPDIPTTYQWGYSGSAWSVSSNNLWLGITQVYLGDLGSPQAGSTGSCGALYTMVFVDATGGVFCLAESGPVANPYPAAVTAGADGMVGGASAWSMVGQILAESVGSTSYSGTGGHADVAVAVDEMWTLNNYVQISGASGGPTGTGTGATGRQFVPLNPLEDDTGTACPGDVSSGYFGSFGGVSMTGGSAGPALLASSFWPGTTSLAEFSSLTCSNAWDEFAAPWTATAPPDWFQGGGSLAGPCGVTAFDGPNSVAGYKSGDSYQWTLTGSVGTRAIVVAPDDGPTWIGGVTPPTTDPGVTNEVAYRGYFWPPGTEVASFDGSGTQSKVVSVTMPRDENAGAIEFFCFQSSGGPTYMGDDTTLSVGGNQGVTNQQSCVDAATQGLSLFNPSSWVSAIEGVTVCGLEYLFIPDSTHVTTIEETFGVTSNAPTPSTDSASQWLGSMAVGAAQFPLSELSTIKTDADSGTCGLPQNPSISVGGHGFSTCDILAQLTPGSSSSATVNTGLGYLRDTLTAFFWLLMSVALFGLIRRALTSTASGGGTGDESS